MEPEQTVQHVAEHGKGIGGWLYTILIFPLIHGKVREFLSDLLWKKWTNKGNKPLDPRYISVSDFKEFIKRNDEQHAEGRHIMHEAISEFGGARRDIAEVKGTVNTILEFVRPR